MPVRSIAFAPTGNHALSAAASERSIAVWNTSGSKRAKKLGGVAVASLALDDPAISLCTCGGGGGGGGGGDDGSFYAAAVTEAGEVFVWLCTPEGEGALVGVPVARVRVGERKAAPGAGPAGSGDVVLAAGLEAVDGGDPAGWLVGRLGCPALGIRFLVALHPAHSCTRRLFSLASVCHRTREDVNRRQIKLCIPLPPAVANHHPRRVSRAAPTQSFAPTYSIIKSLRCCIPTASHSLDALASATQPYTNDRCHAGGGSRQHRQAHL